MSEHTTSTAQTEFEPTNTTSRASAVVEEGDGSTTNEDVEIPSTIETYTGPAIEVDQPGGSTESPSEWSQNQEAPDMVDNESYEHLPVQDTPVILGVPKSPQAPDSSGYDIKFNETGEYSPTS